MKRMICLLLILSLAFCLFGCGKKEEAPEVPVKFYYPRATTVYGTEDGVIAWEHREAAGHEKDYAYLVEQYLSGPQSQELVRGFPMSVKLKKLQLMGSSARIVLSDFASMLTGMDLTVACACLSATVIELTGVQTVTVQAESAYLDGNATITMSRDQILLWDDSTQEETADEEQ